MTHKSKLDDIVAGDKIICYIEPNAMLKRKNRLELQTVRTVTKSGRIVTDSHIFAKVKYGGWYKEYGGKSTEAYAPLEPNYRFSYLYPNAETMLAVYEQMNATVNIDELIEKIRQTTPEKLVEIKTILERN